jgi:hypothetical protein
MSYSVAALISAYMDLLKRPANADGLGIPVILGFPETGRKEPALPMAALTFEEDDYHNTQGAVRRIGQIPPSGSTVTLSLYLFADTELNLLNLIDRLRDVRERLGSFTVQERVFTARYAATQRSHLGDQNAKLVYATETAITLSTHM